MKKGMIFVLLMAALVFFGTNFTSCSTDFWDGFVDGYNSTRGPRSYTPEQFVPARD